MHTYCKLSFQTNAISSRQDSSSDTTFPGASLNGWNLELERSLLVWRMALVLLMSSYITKKREKSIIKSSTIHKTLTSRFVPVCERPTSNPMQQMQGLRLVLPQENFVSLGTQKTRKDNLKNKNVFKQDLLFLDLK